MQLFVVNALFCQYIICAAVQQSCFVSLIQTSILLEISDDRLFHDEGRLFQLLFISHLLLN